ncbi:hypothetical protein EBR43_02490 [bacterium]|nr:hypothetical protein [bacterium]NBX72102.1 hypothetical protein [bacterium]
MPREYNLPADYLNKILNDIDIGECVTKGSMLFQHFKLTPTELTDTLETPNSPIKGFSETYFFTYLEILRIIDENFVAAVSQPDIDTESVKANFLALIASVPAKLLTYLSEKQPNKTELFGMQLNEVIPFLTENLNKINKIIPDRLRDLFNQREKEIADIFINSADNFDPNLAKDLGSLSHRWIEGEDADRDVYIRALVSHFNAATSRVAEEIYPLPDEEIANLVFKAHQFLPEYDNRNPIPSFLLLSQMHQQCLDRNQAGSLQQISRLFYDTHQGLPSQMKKFSQSIQLANILVFALQQFINSATTLKQSK